MEVVDSQVHIWKKDSPDHPWDPTLASDRRRRRTGPEPGAPQL